MTLQPSCLNLKNSYFEVSETHIDSNSDKNYLVKLINKNMFQVSNKSTLKSYELGSKFKIKIPVQH